MTVATVAGNQTPSRQVYKEYTIVTPAEWVMGALGFGAFSLSIGGGLVARGKDLQRINGLEEQVKLHHQAIDVLSLHQDEARSAMSSALQRIDNLAERAVDQQKLWASELARVMDSVKASHDNLNTKLDALQRQNHTELEQVTYNLRDVQTVVRGLSERRPAAN